MNEKDRVLETIESIQEITETNSQRESWDELYFYPCAADWFADSIKAIKEIVENAKDESTIEIVAKHFSRSKESREEYERLRSQAREESR
jgi:hypothetical protein